MSAAKVNDVPDAPGAASIRIALAGNPNAGKTTLLNKLTGMRLRVGNYPGVTVEKTEGYFHHGGHRVTVVDLPGTYSLTALSVDELVARNYVIDEHPDLVVSVVDASNLERNLYLAVQFMELGLPLLVVFNKSDLARAKGIAVDTDKLSRLLNVRIVETVGSTGEGFDALRDAIVSMASAPPRLPAQVRYGREIEAEISALLPLAEGVASHISRGERWVAIKLLENDEDVCARVAACGAEGATLLAAARGSAERIDKHFGDRPEIVIADRRYGFISGACQETVKATVEVRHDISDRIDQVVTSPLMGIPIFLLVMYLLFKFTFSVGAVPMGWIESGIAWLGSVVREVWPRDLATALRSLLLDGVIGGVGGVLVFVPNLALLFAAIAFLEDSGYMARGAFIMDRFMHKIGLHGRSFIPAMIGFGCTVPAILATRTLESRRDRMATMLVLPLISCGARLPIYTLFIAALFPEAWRAHMLFLLYVTGIALAAVLAKVLRVTIFRGEMSLFVMELPPYRMPTPRGILRHTWDRTRLFLRKAGTVIVMASVVLWVMTNYPKPSPERIAGLSASEARPVALAASAAGRIGKALEPAMELAGFDWKTTTALIGALAAKEIFVAQLGIVYALDEADETSVPLRERLQAEYSPLQAFCIMLFCLISSPCVATLAATRMESGSWRWAALQFVGLTVLAYGVTFAVYQVGRLVLGTAV